MNPRWNAFQQNYLDLSELGFALDLSGLQLAPGFFVDMEPRIAKSYDAMQQLESGAIANPDENRMVGHYWLRNAALAPDPATRAAITDTIDKIGAFAKQIHSGEIRPQSAPKFETVILIGIGGSALGPQLAAEALGSAKDPMKIFYIDNTDPDGIDLVLQKVAAAKGGIAAALAVVTSKSGGTKETRNGMLEIANAYQKLDLNFAKHFVAITCPESDLDKTAIQQKWLARFPLWDWVGGRTSVMSAVGLVPMALQGLNIFEFLSGAGAMDAATRTRETRRNPAAMLALAWYHATGGAGKKDMVILPYKDRLELFSKYLQQLVMESLGKEKDTAGRVVEQGIAVYGNKGATDQHAYVQQLREGVHNFFVTFIEVLYDRAGAKFEVEPGVTSGDYLSAFLQGTRKALRDKNRETITITIDTVSPRSLGALIALYERAVGFYASLVGINAYHQPGVEAGKKAAAAVLQIQEKVVSVLKLKITEAATVDQIAKAAGLDGEQETIFKILDHAAANRANRIVKIAGTTPFNATYQIAQS
ncbi:MAG: glucose-6-phosphate isomerase [Planctomycetota bacterium]